MTLDSLGGYRLVRKLGEGPRAEVHLAFPEHDTSEARPVAIKVYRPGVTEQSIIVEIEALSRAAGEHVLPLLDLAGTPDGTPAVIIERIAGGSLGRLLRDRGSLSVGEAITILAPLALALARLHSAGVVHGAVRLESVMFDDTGAPLWTCFGAARLIEPLLPPARLEAEPAVSDDVRAFERVAAAVLDRVPGSVELPQASAAGWLESVAALLFELGEAHPVRLSPDIFARELPARVLTAAPLPELQPAPRSSAWAALALPEWLDVPALMGRLDQLRSALGTVRPRVWVGAGAVVLALVVALAVIPSGGTDATAAPSASPPTSAAPTGPESPVTGDDPVLALPELLDARAQCIRDLSVLCLDAVGQEGSAALADDQQLIRDLQNGGELAAPLTVQPDELVLEERMGDSAIVSLGDVADSEPASVLLMKGEAGWRIRDYLER